jgi:hypothetical protein
MRRGSAAEAALAESRDAAVRETHNHLERFTGWLLRVADRMHPISTEAPVRGARLGGY